MNHDNEHREDTEIGLITRVLSATPSESEVQDSFRRTMQAVTSHTAGRILEVPQHNRTEESIISPFLMQLHTKVSLGAGALVVMLLVGYMTFNRTNPYVDINDAALEDQAAYDLAVPEDDLADLDEDSIGSPEDMDVEDTAPTTGANAPATTPLPASSLDVSAELASFDSLFSSDDIDDSALESWVTDTSASDGLIESYDI